MKIRYMGQFSGNEDDLPRQPHRPGAVQFKEPDMKKLAVWANVSRWGSLWRSWSLWHFRAGSRWMAGDLYWGL